MPNRWSLYRQGERRETRWDVAILFLAYAVAVLVGVFGARTNLDYTVFWAANGVLVAAFLTLRTRWLAPFMAACFVFNFVLNYGNGVPLVTNLVYTSLNFVLSLCVALGARRLCGAALDLSRPKRLIQFAGIALIASVLEAIIGCYLTDNWLWIQGGRWFTCEFLGLMLGAPAMLMLMKRHRNDWAVCARPAERTVVLILLAGLTAAAFSQGTIPLFTLIYPVVLFAAFRLGPSWVYLAVFVVAAVATLLTVRSLGPIAALDLQPDFNRVELLQLFLASVFLSALPAVSALAERGRVQTRLARREVSAREARRRAEEAVAAKSSFLAVMSHEIRTPLNGIIGFSQLLSQRDDLPVEASRQIDLVARSSDVLLGLVNDILDFSKIEAGRFDLSPACTRLLQVAEDAAELMRGAAEAKGLTLRLESNLDAGQAYLVDDMRLRQVLLNLLSNAIKFTQQGSVTLSVAATPQSDADRIRIGVRDTGVGIPAEKMALLFKPFSQLDPSVARNHGGTGLGLTISQALVELMDGHIAVDSGPGGSEFWFAIDLPRVEAAVVERGPDAAVDPGRPPRVLVVDDHPINREVATLMLQGAGCDVEACEDAASGVEAVRGGGFDIVLMDLRMPGMNGFEATRAIRALDGPASAIPILAVSADVVSEDILQCRVAGMNGHVAKPINQERLIAAIVAALDEAAAADAAPALKSA